MTEPAVLVQTDWMKETAVNTDIDDPFRNALLASLSVADAALLNPSIKTAAFEQGQVINEPGEEVEQIYFPQSGMISLLAVMRDGKAVETATVGREGGVGLMAGLGAHIMMTRATIQLPVIASKVAAVPFRKAVRQSAALQQMVLRYIEAHLAQVQNTAACNALHSVQSRLARWILQTRDRAEADKFPLTQELLSEMLGVRRTSISEIAGKLQSLGLIRYKRGSMEIINRTALEEAACECYQTINEQIARARR